MQRAIMAYYTNIYSMVGHGTITIDISVEIHLNFVVKANHLTVEVGVTDESNEGKQNWIHLRCSRKLTFACFGFSFLDSHSFSF